MKNAIVIKAMADAVKAKVERADGLGTKTTWDTKDHLAALAKAVATATDPDHDEAYVVLIRDVLEDGYNISGFQQMLEKAYAAKGHFQRAGTKKTQGPSELYKALGIA